MFDSEPTPMQSKAPIVLEAMTLRGIGPYVYGDRLEIRPLTVLCGENGSGKSTWLEILSKLRATVRMNPAFPFCVLSDPDRQDATCYTRGINGRLLLPSGITMALGDSFDEHECRDFEEQRERILQGQEESQFGPPCSIGLEMKATDASTRFGIQSSNWRSLPSEFSESSQSPMRELLWHARIVSGTAIRIRWAYPDTSFDLGRIIPLNGLTDYMEIAIDGVTCIRLSADLSGTNRSGLSYRFEVAPEVLGVSKSQDEPLRLLAICDSIGIQKVLLESISRDAAQSMFMNFVELFRSLVDEALDGLFHIGAIRQIEKREFSDTLDQNDTRYVGYQGQMTQTQNVYWHHNHLRQPGDESIGSQFIFSTNSLTVGMFVDFWMSWLTEATVNFGSPSSDSLEGKCVGTNNPPVGCLAISSPKYSNPEDYGATDCRNAVTSNTVGGPGCSHLMSCGFHQLLPIVTQFALMKRYEITAVENPEAHLHPSLQVKLAEFLIHQSLAGKCVVIETHSDLVVRRILRAIREEQIKQEAVRVYFSHLQDARGEYAFAELDQLSINEQGQVANWPSGFMDEDLREADRWLTSYERFRSEEKDE